jgi:hypothetical protein
MSLLRSLALCFGFGGFGTETGVSRSDVDLLHILTERRLSFLD